MLFGIMAAVIIVAASSPCWWWPQEILGRYKELGRKKHNEERTDVEEGKLMSKGKEHFPTDLLCRTTGATG